MRTSIAIAAVLALVVGAMGALFASGHIRFNRPSRAEFPVRGIDISHHQGEIDWAKLQRAEFDFAYIKATEGADFRDPRFLSNWRGIGATGRATGAYHFFTFCTPGLLQAENFLAVVPRDGPMLPAAVDVEYSGNCGSPPSEEQIRSELGAFLERLEAETRIRPILYVTRRAYRRIVSGFFEEHAIWARNTFWEPGIIGGRPWIFWQFTDAGEMPGIRGPVDMNVFSGSRVEFARLLQ